MAFFFFIKGLIFLPQFFDLSLNIQASHLYIQFDSFHHNLQEYNLDICYFFQLHQRKMSSKGLLWEFSSFYQVILHELWWDCFSINAYRSIIQSNRLFRGRNFYFQNPKYGTPGTFYLVFLFFHIFYTFLEHRVRPIHQQTPYK